MNKNAHITPFDDQCRHISAININTKKISNSKHTLGNITPVEFYFIYVVLRGH